MNGRQEVKGVGGGGKEGVARPHPIDSLAHDKNIPGSPIA